MTWRTSSDTANTQAITRNGRMLLATIVGSAMPVHAAIHAARQASISAAGSRSLPEMRFRPLSAIGVRDRCLEQSRAPGNNSLRSRVLRRVATCLGGMRRLSIRVLIVMANPGHRE